MTHAFGSPKNNLPVCSLAVLCKRSKFCWPASTSQIVCKSLLNYCLARKMPQIRPTRKFWRGAPCRISRTVLILEHYTVHWSTRWDSALLHRQQSTKFPAANISIRPPVANWIFLGFVAAHLEQSSGFLSRRSDGLELTARFVAWSCRRVWTC